MTDVKHVSVDSEIWINLREGTQTLRKCFACSTKKNLACRRRRRLGGSYFRFCGNASGTVCPGRSYLHFHRDRMHYGHATFDRFWDFGLE